MTLLMTDIIETLAPLHNKIYCIITETTKEHTLAALSQQNGYKHIKQAVTNRKQCDDEHDAQKPGFAGFYRGVDIESFYPLALL